MKKQLGWLLMLVGGLLCLVSVICIPVVLTADDIPWGERLCTLPVFLPLAVAFGALCRLGFRLKAKSEQKPAAQEPSKAQGPTKTAEAPKRPRPVDPPVIHRPVLAEKGVFRYQIDPDRDLLPAGSEGLAYPDLPRNFQLAANLGQHILDLGGQVTGISIGGGSTEVSHTGTVAYGNYYSTLDAFAERCMADLDAAEAEAQAKYGIWFSSLDYASIRLQAALRETELTVDVSCFAPMVTVRFGLGTGPTGFWYLIQLVRRFGRPDYDQGVGADRPCWDEAQALFQRTYQLDAAGTWSLRSDMTAEGDFVRYQLDGEDIHRAIPPEQMAQLVEVLEAEMPEKYLPAPAVACARYLQHHDGQALLALLEGLS